MYEKVKETILSKVKIAEADLEKAFEYSTLCKYKKGDHVLRTGDYCRFIGFLNGGLIVTTVNVDGKEIACNFVYEGCFFTYTEGISLHTPSHKSFLALE